MDMQINILTLHVLVDNVNGILFYRSMSWSTALSCKVEVEWVAQISKLGYCKGLYNEEWSVVLQRWLGMGGSNIQVGNFLGPFNREWSVKFEVFWVSSEESVVDSCCGSSVSQVFPVSIHDPYILSSFLHLQYILLQANAIVYISWVGLYSVLLLVLEFGNALQQDLICLHL